MTAASAAGVSFFAVLLLAGADGPPHRASAAAPVARSAGALARTDSISVTRAEYVVARHRLYVEARGPSASATLRVLVTSTNQALGTLTNRGGGLYRGEFTWPRNPENVTVLDLQGRRAVLAVTLAR